MVKEIFTFLMISGVVLGAIFSTIAFYSKRGRDKSIVFLNLVVIFLLLNNLQAVLFETVFVDTNFFVKKLQLPWYVLITPAFYTFLTYYLKIEKKIALFIYPSIILFVIELIVRVILVPYFYTKNNSLVVAKYVQTEEIINATYSVFLFIKACILLFKYATLYQNILSFDNIKWLKNFMLFGSLVMLMWVCAIILNINEPLNTQIFMYYPLRLSSTLLLYWLGYQGFYNYNIMTERVQLRQIITKDELKNNNHKTQEEIFFRIKSYIKQHKRHLNPDFSLEQLSLETGISISKLSQIINQQSGHSFPDYINLIRVEKAKKYLTKPQYDAYTIVAIGLECGFNSKSTFYSAFKKFTNTTPTEYKKQNL